MNYDEWLKIAEKNPDRFRVKGGLILDRQAGGRIVSSSNQDKLIPLTPERSQELHALRRIKKQRAEMQGKISGVREWLIEKGMDASVFDASRSDDELIQQEAQAESFMMYCMTLAFLRTADRGGGLRGLAETYRAINGNEAKDTPPMSGGISATPEKILALVQMFDEEIQRRVERSKAIDGRTNETV